MDAAPEECAPYTVVENAGLDGRYGMGLSPR